METEQKEISETNNFFDIFNSKSVLILGFVMILGGGQNPDLFIAGISITLGTLAYRSAKNRI